MLFNIHMLWHIFQFIIFMALLMVFMYKVFENHLTVSKKKFWIKAVVHTAILTVIICLFFTQVSPYRNLAVVGIVLILMFSVILYRTSTKKKMIFLFFILLIMVNIQVDSILFARATLDFQILPSVSSYENGDFLILSSIYCVIIFGFVYRMLTEYYKRVVDDNIVMAHTKLFFCLPLLFFVALMIFDRRIENHFSKIPKEFLLPFLLLNIFAFFAYYAALKSIIDNYDAAMEREKLIEAENQLELWEAQYINLQDKIHSDAQIRHDWRQHIIAIMGYVDNKDFKGLEEYLADYKEKYLVPDKSPVCNVPALNMLFQYYQHKAEEHQIDLVIGNVMLGECNISISELTILFGNLLENAIEACGKIPVSERYIRLKIVQKEHKLVMSCENSFDGLVLRSADGIKSRKKGGGLGISSIQGIVEKYHGQIRLEDGDGVFRVYAYLQDKGSSFAGS